MTVESIIYFISKVFINVTLIFIGVLFGYYLSWRYYLKEKRELLDDIFWLGDKDGDNPEIEYE